MIQPDRPYLPCLRLPCLRRSTLAFIAVLLLAPPISLPERAEALPANSTILPLYDTGTPHTTHFAYDLQQAGATMARQDYASAIEHLRAAREKRPTSLLSVYNLGICHMALAQQTGIRTKASEHQLQQAELAFLRGKSLNPHLQAIDLKLGKLALLQKRPDAAKSYYLRSLAQHPQSSVLHFNLGGVYDEQAQYSKARTHYEQAIALNPNFTYAYNNLGLVYEATQHPGLAEAAYLQALRLKPTYAFARLNLGNLYATAGRLKEARVLYLQTLERDPDNSWGHLYLGNLFLKEGDLAHASAEYRTVIRLKPDYALVYYLQAMTLQQLGETDEALAASTMYLMLTPTGPFAAEMALLKQLLRPEDTPADSTTTTVNRFLRTP